eukprot:2665828-Lingulodinium_polyedra.AAC.1
MWPQHRIFASNLADDNICRACQGEAGTTRHRLWRCPATERQRYQETADPVVGAALPMAAGGAVEHPLWSYGLLQLPLDGGDIPAGLPARELHWLSRPSGGLLEGEIFIDGSTRLA